MSLTSYRDVSDVMLTQGGNTINLTTVGWLDIYQASGLSAVDLADAFDRARAIAGTILTLPIDREYRT